MVLQAASTAESTFLSVTTTGWIAIGALVTALMALATGFLAWKSRSEASAARDTVTEIQKDRELTFRPYISWKLSGGTRVNGVNLGRGPALNTVFCVVEQDERLWRWFAELVDFSPGQEINDADDLVLLPKQGQAPPRPQIGRTVPHKVAFCEDQLGNRYRFLPGQVIADVWRPGEAKPDWVMWYEAYAPIATRG
jgi:hypothetical protein